MTYGCTISVLRGVPLMDSADFLVEYLQSTFACLISIALWDAVLTSVSHICHAHMPRTVFEAVGSRPIQPRGVKCGLNRTRNFFPFPFPREVGRGSAAGAVRAKCALLTKACNAALCKIDSAPSLLILYPKLTYPSDHWAALLFLKSSFEANVEWVGVACAEIPLCSLLSFWAK